MGVILNWSTGYTGTVASVDDTTANFPTLSNGTHDVLDSHVNQLALAVIQLETIQATLAPLVVKDEGGSLTTGATSIDFVGAGITASTVGTAVTVTVTGDALGTAGGDLQGTYPNPTVVAMQSYPISSNLPNANEILVWDGATWVPGTSLANLTLSGNLTITGTVDGRDVSVDGAAQDSHLADTTNPHNTSIANIGAGTLAQLNTAISDANLLSDKTTIVMDATTARTLADSDNGSMIIFTNVAAKTVTVPDTLSVGTSFVLVTSEAAPAMITVVAGGTMTLQAKASATVPLITNEKWSVIGVTVTGATTAVVYGDLG